MNGSIETDFKESILQNQSRCSYFCSIKKIEYYIYYYNNLRPHSTLGYRPPLVA